ncbi:phospholipid carrier-dependent glycosyltransferase [Planosporangium thailandense]|uniref:Polyprenol-phosphate-mannose--protein mannosyltransferase n=1 Tax=Planosporangium thailandense TaxID=765197 RepID=A0ABX0XTS3_9ACTN|nr:phospholipid carrier-dependent glycosyltransferase [Planosporangium thailandense]NJC69406.1 phospholipid carrier-dependent glycosyltransferase [Planosporangium thailandense]
MTIEPSTADTARPAVPPDDAVPAVPEAVRRRLLPRVGPDPRSWVATGVIVLIALALRLIGLAHPRGKIFDETYYATEGQELFDHNVEWKPETSSGDFVVHPPLGKWIIGVGEWLFGRDGHGHWLTNGEFGWRISAVVFGTLSVLMLVRVARRLFGSTVLGCAAGLLMALDGMHFVLSRSALLDIFLMTFILAGFACLVMDRDQRRARWLAAMESGVDPTRPGRAGRPHLGVPWWRLAAAVMLGCAASVKWSALWDILAFLVLLVAWEIGARRAAGAPHPWRDTALDELGWVLAFLGIIGAVYLTSWTGWFLSDDGWDRHYLAQQLHQRELPVIGALQNLYHYHMEALHFHDNLHDPHRYQSWPWQWLLLGRPVAFYYSQDGPCGAANCSAEVLMLGTPLLWWSFLPALAGLVWFGTSRRDWRAFAIGLCAAAGIVPWFWYEIKDRTMFAFYALPSLPFLVLAVVYVLGAIIGPAPAAGAAPASGRRRPVPDRRLFGTIFAAVYVGLVALCFAYFYPIYTGKIITYAQWSARMWLGGRWI